ncbi:MAG: 2-oxoglutarate dehydrogenase, E2 component, dihydrolipoamide succinyltransferase [Acidimicrobiales bacterium]
MADIEMPQLGETVTEGTITRWLKQVGDRVEADEPLFEVSTDKVDSEVPSPVAGFLAEIRVPEGDTVDVGTVLAVVADAPPAGGAEAAPTEAAAPAEPAAPPPPPPPVEAAPLPPPPPVEAAPAAPASPPPPPPAPAPAAASAAAPVGAPAPSAASGLVLSPLVRRLLADNGLDPASIQGTGIGGRITRSDVERAIEVSPGNRSAPAPAAAPATPSAPAPAPARASAPAPRSGTGDTVEKLNNMRRITGEHMVMSKATSPHAMTAVEVDYENVERVRRVNRDGFKASEGFSLTYLPFIARAVIDALRDFPHLNASVGDGELIVHNYVNLAIAVDLNFEGLLAPVIHEADDKRLRAIARDISDLATRARTKKLSADDISGGTFTISNSGPFGTFMVIPVINQPQVAILSTDGVTRKPVVITDADGSEAIAIHSVGVLAMSWDHRAFDGAYAAAFLREVKEILETRDWAAELA